MKKIVVMTLMAVMMISSMAVAAQVEEANITKTIGTVGAHGNNIAYFNFVEGFKATTLFSVVYIDLTTEWGKAAFQIVMEAKKSGKKIGRVIYNTDSGPNGMTMLELIALL